jgi:ABC-type uncharacterized transport system auxiliary subunit
MRHDRTIHRLVLLMSPLALSACISLPFSRGEERSPPSLFTLHETRAGTTEISTDAAARTVVVVPRPELPPGFDSERIAIQFEQDGRIDYYADAQWSANLTDLMHDVFVERAQRKLPGTVVGKPELIPSANYRLSFRVTDFGPVYRDSPDMPPRLDAGLTVTVIELPSETVKAQLTVKKNALSPENRLSTVTAELRKLLHAVMDEALERAAPYITESPAIVRSE